MRYVAALATLLLAACTPQAPGPSAQLPGPPPVTPSDPTEDRVGLPENYQTALPTFYVFDRPDNRQVRVVYANDQAARARTGEPYPYGSVLVMETHRALSGEDNRPALDAEGRFQRGDLAGIFVMRKERGFGAKYGDQRTGEWEYVAFRPDGSYQTRPEDSVSCATCHLDAGPARDWVYRGNLFFTSASGAVPALSPGEPPNTVRIDSYTFVPGEIRVKSGATVTWTNEDQVPHTVTAFEETVLFSGKVNQGARFTQTLRALGSFDYICAIHPAMRARVVVES